MNGLEKYQARIKPLWNQIKSTVGLSRAEISKTVRYNINLLLDAREGDYLIKRMDRGKIDTDSCKYLTVENKFDGYFSLGRRRTAQWFHREEIKDIFKLKNLKGFKVVKR